MMSVRVEEGEHGGILCAARLGGVGRGCGGVGGVCGDCGLVGAVGEEVGYDYARTEAQKEGAGARART